MTRGASRSDGRLDGVGVGQQDVVADALEGPHRVLVGVAPGVMDVQRRAVVDAPGPAVPHQQVRVGHAPIGVGGERIQPHDVGRERRIDRIAGGRIEGHRAGQEVDPEVQTGAGMDEVLDLAIGLGIAQATIDLDGHQVRHGQADGPAELAGQPLGDERARTLAGAPELDHVQPVVVGLHQPGQRATLPERGDVAGRGDVAHGRDHRRHGAEPSGPMDRPRGRGILAADAPPGRVPPSRHRRGDAARPAGDHRPARLAGRDPRRRPATLGRARGQLDPPWSSRYDVHAAGRPAGRRRDHPDADPDRVRDAARCQLPDGLLPWRRFGHPAVPRLGVLREWRTDHVRGVELRAAGHHHRRPYGAAVRIGR